MYGKDDRSKDNRKNMKQHKYYHKQQQQQQQQQPQRGGNTSSSSPQTTAVRSIVDVADSSDEPRFARKGWSSGTRSLAPQKNRDMLDTLPPTDTDDVEQLVDGTPIDENARAQLRAGDYKQMSQFPSMGGGHFSFGAEKEWNNIAEGQTQLHTKAASSYFTLNLGLLNCGLQTIPFYKRMDYSTSMFTRQQIVAQNEAAERAERIYQERVLRESNGIASANKSRAPSAKSIKELPPATGAATDAPDELDELLALTDTQLAQTTIATGQTLPIASPVQVQPATPSASKNDVEQWLDSVLDE
ncbi:uncharacterized protein Aven [Drosophila virilis]|uniref:Apoptosis and caspase activation inhibitor n=1 Tax=Drosophila virilis TaxID=7244 RepID=B4M884_DROVI|nr:uncharacterized protein LOC6633291 [Drosophila virilis]EDW62360.1 uncharacterized protein Dvir_GJ16651 [Drosophila virilis]